MKNKDIKIQVALVVLTIAIVVCVGIGISYAYYTYNGNFTSGDNVNAANFEIDTTLNSSSVISNTNLTLIDASDVASAAEAFNFSITNKSVSTVNGNFEIILSNMILSKNLYSEYFKWELLSNNVAVANGDFSTATRTDIPVPGEAFNVATTVQNISLNPTPILLTPGQSSNMTLRIWLENDSSRNQMELVSGSFNSRVTVEAVPIR